jgi:hypothetical protein
MAWFLKASNINFKNMATISDFNIWIKGIELEDHSEVYALYYSVKDLDEHPGFKCTQETKLEGNKYFIKCAYSDDILILVSDKAREAFLKHIEKTYAGEMDIESWYSLKHELEKED